MPKWFLIQFSNWIVQYWIVSHIIQILYVSGLPFTNDWICLYRHCWLLFVCLHLLCQANCLRCGDWYSMQSPVIFQSNIIHILSLHVKRLVCITSWMAVPKRYTRKIQNTNLLKTPLCGPIPLANDISF